MRGTLQGVCGGDSRQRGAGTEHCSRDAWGLGPGLGCSTQDVMSPRRTHSRVRMLLDLQSPDIGVGQRGPLLGPEGT